MRNEFRQVSDIQGKVRRDGKLYSLKSFITPTEPLIRDLAATLYQGGNFVKDAQDFVHSEIKYKSDIGDFWKYPVSVLSDGYDDCEGTAVLLCSILRNYIPAEDVYCVAGNWKGEGHCWCVAGDPDWHILETTRSSNRPAKEKDYSPDVFFNDQYCYGKPSDFGFLLVGERYSFLTSAVN